MVQNCKNDVKNKDMSTTNPPIFEVLLKDALRLLKYEFYFKPSDMNH